jgi:hypothetical protein
MSYTLWYFIAWILVETQSARVQQNAIASALANVQSENVNGTNARVHTEAHTGMQARAQIVQENTTSGSLCITDYVLRRNKGEYYRRIDAHHLDLGTVGFLDVSSGHVESRYRLDDEYHGLSPDAWLDEAIHRHTPWGSISSETSAKLKYEAKVGGNSASRDNFSMSLEELRVSYVPLIRAIRKSETAVQHLQEQSDICEARKSCDHLVLVTSVIKLQEESKGSSTSKDDMKGSVDVDAGDLVGVDIGVGPKVNIGGERGSERETTTTAAANTVVAYLVSKVGVTNGKLDPDALKLLRECNSWGSSFSPMCQACNSMFGSHHKFGVG